MLRSAFYLLLLFFGCVCVKTHPTFATRTRVPRNVKFSLPPPATWRRFRRGNQARGGWKKATIQSATQFSERCDETWDRFCDSIEERGQVGVVIAGFLRRLIVDSPVVLGFSLLCVLLYALDFFARGQLQPILCCRDKFHPFSPVAWVQLVTHIFAHADYAHLKGNMVSLMLVGPATEKVFGSTYLAVVIFLVAVASGFVHILMGDNNSCALGASGVVFAVILLSSLVSASAGAIPLSFVIAVALHVTDEITSFFFSDDDIGHHGHLAGALVGTCAGFFVHRHPKQKQAKRITNDWLQAFRTKMKVKKTEYLGGALSKFLSN